MNGGQADRPRSEDPDSTNPESPVGAEERGLSVVLPAFNLETVIAHTIDALREELRPVASTVEFIVVDDGSSDATASVVAELCKTNPDVRLVRNRHNLGKGMSVYEGLLAARFAKVCFTDGDLPFTLGSYARVMRPLLAGRPLVVASRRLPDSMLLVRMQVLNYAARRHVLGLIFNRAARTALGISLPDTQCGLKAFDRGVGIELFQRVRSPRFLFDLELLLAARYAGVEVDQVPVGVEYHDARSSLRLTVDLLRMFFGFAMICARNWLGHYRVPNPHMRPDLVRELAYEVRAAEDDSGNRAGAPNA